MERRTMRGRLLLGLAASVCAALVIFVVVPWLAAPGPGDETVEKVSPSLTAYEAAGEPGMQGIERVGVMSLPSPPAPEHPVLGAAAGLPPLPAAEKVAAAVSEPSEAATQTAASRVEIVEAVEALEPAGFRPPVPATVEASEAPQVVRPASVVESAQAAPVEAPAGTQATPASASGSRWSEFDLPPNRTVLEGPDAIINMPLGVDGSAPAVETAAAKPSPGVPMSAAHPAGQAGPLPPGLPPRPAAGRPEAAVVPHTLRGAMGYRLPLVSRQQVPDQVVSGVLIPAHTTYVILQPGYWELVGLSPDEASVLRAAAEKMKADEPAVQSEPPARGWNPFRLFRRNRTPANGE